MSDVEKWGERAGSYCETLITPLTLALHDLVSLHNADAMKKRGIVNAKLFLQYGYFNMCFSKIVRFPFLVKPR